MKLSAKIVLTSALLIAPLAMANPYMSAVPFTSPRDAGIRGSAEVRTEARFSSNKSLASGKAKYRERTRGKLIEQRFDIEVEDANPGDSLAVFVNGNMYGTMIVNDLGVAELQFRTAEFIDDPGDGTPIPTEFPRTNPGATISVGDMSGTFQAR